MKTNSRKALVTGASRGLGKGIALALGKAGYTVFITGRTIARGEHDLAGTIFETGSLVDSVGGHGIPIVCDHSSQDSVEDLFRTVGSHTKTLDLVVNNAFTVPDELASPGAFWQKSLGMLGMFRVGLESSYVTTWHSAPFLLASKEHKPLVVNISGFGASCYVHGPAYGAVKAGVDKMTHDMAADFRPYNVSVISLWPGLLRTERTEAALLADPGSYPESRRIMETPEFNGRVIAALDGHPTKERFSGNALISAEIGRELGVVDTTGKSPVSRRKLLAGPLVFSNATAK